MSSLQLPLLRAKWRSKVTQALFILSSRASHVVALKVSLAEGAMVVGCGMFTTISIPQELSLRLHIHTRQEKQEQLAHATHSQEPQRCWTALLPTSYILRATRNHYIRRWPSSQCQSQWMQPIGRTTDLGFGRQFNAQTVSILQTTQWLSWVMRLMVRGLSETRGEPAGGWVDIFVCSLETRVG